MQCDDGHKLVLSHSWIMVLSRRKHSDNKGEFFQAVSPLQDVLASAKTSTATATRGGSTARAVRCPAVDRAILKAQHLLKNGQLPPIDVPNEIYVRQQEIVDVVPFIITISSNDEIESDISVEESLRPSKSSMESVEFPPLSRHHPASMNATTVLKRNGRLVHHNATWGITTTTLEEGYVVDWPSDEEEDSKRHKEKQLPTCSDSSWMGCGTLFWAKGKIHENNLTAASRDDIEGRRDRWERYEEFPNGKSDLSKGSLADI